MREKELFDTKDKTIDSMNSEINKLKNSLQEVIKKDKEIQELKNQHWECPRARQMRSAPTAVVTYFMGVRFITF